MKPALILSMLMIVDAAGGCASSVTPSPQGRLTAGDEAFAAGAKRPPTAKTVYAMAQILATQGRDAEAEIGFNRAIGIDPGFMPAYCALAELQMRQRHIDQAIQVIQAGLKKSPCEHVLVNDLGMCQLLNGNVVAAAAAFTRASGMAPDEHRYRANLAMALGMLGRYDEATALYLQVLAPSDAHYNLAVLCEARQDLDRARREHLAAQPR